MATLTGNQIDQTYSGLIKTTDNAAIGAVEKEITDGVGTASTLKLGTTSASFVGDLDLSGATVTGLPAAGLVNGTGTDSLKQADSLVTNAGNASGPQSIAIGNGANATGSQSVAIGNYAEATNVGCASVGEYAGATGLYSSAWGRTAQASGDGAVAFGQQTQANQAGAVAMGRQVQSDTADTTHVRALKIVAPDGVALGGNGITFLSPDGTQGVVTLLDTDELALDGVAIGGGGAAGLVSGAAADSMISDASLTTNPASALCVRGIALGDNARAAFYANQVDGIAIGTDALSEATNSIAIGKGAWGQSGDEIAIGTSAHSRLGDGIAIGRSAYAGNTGNIALGKLANCDLQYTGAMALGTDTVVAANGGVALGASVTADKVDTVSMKALDLQTASTPSAGGIIMTDAGSTERRLNITAAGALQIDSTPVGGGAAGLVAGTGTDSMQSAASLTATAANASGSNSIAIGGGAKATDAFGIAIGSLNVNAASQAVAIGAAAKAQHQEAISIGTSATCGTIRAISIGAQSDATATNAIALGYFAQATAAGAVALGDAVTAATANTATVKLLQIANYATMSYADDTAAAAGGIPLGGVYHTSGALKIRIA